MYCLMSARSTKATSILSVMLDVVRITTLECLEAEERAPVTLCLRDLTVPYLTVPYLMVCQERCPSGHLSTVAQLAALSVPTPAYKVPEAPTRTLAGPLIPPAVAASTGRAR